MIRVPICNKERKYIIAYATEWAINVWFPNRESNQKATAYIVTDPSFHHRFPDTIEYHIINHYWIYGINVIPRLWHSRHVWRMPRIKGDSRGSHVLRTIRQSTRATIWNSYLDFLLALRDCRPTLYLPISRENIILFISLPIGQSNYVFSPRYNFQSEL